MKRLDTVFNSHINANPIFARISVAAVFTIAAMTANAANVVSRGSASAARPTVSRANNTDSRMPTLTIRAQNAAATTQNTNTTTQPAPEPEPTPAPVTEPEPEPEPVIIENKADQFSTTLGESGNSYARDANADNLADMVRRQRAALDAAAAGDTAAAAAATSLANGQSSCDIGLRECMKQKCGDDYSKCAGDGDTAWGDKMDACRRNVSCTGKQYRLFTAEIKADRDMNAKLSAYNKIIDCGNEYNDCIVTECGVNYSKCLGKTAGDAAISKCATIAKNCTQQDSGLASRTMNVFATLRQDAEKTIVRDEQRLYEMRDKMRSQCQRLGALFDERSLVCVYTVNFFAGNSATPTASKKAYAGSTFDCTQDWFGIDVTTFKENAYRYTRSQTGASSALMGSGLGIGVGAITSGAIDRAIDRKKAEDAVKKAEKQHEEDYGDKKKSEKTDTPETPAEDKPADKPETKPAEKSDETPVTPTESTPAENPDGKTDATPTETGTETTSTEPTDGSADATSATETQSPSTNNSDTTGATQTPDGGGGGDPMNIEQYIATKYNKKISEQDVNQIKAFITEAKTYSDIIGPEVSRLDIPYRNTGVEYAIYFTDLNAEEDWDDDSRHIDTTHMTRCEEIGKKLNATDRITFTSTQRGASKMTYHGCYYVARWVD